MYSTGLRNVSQIKKIAGAFALPANSTKHVERMSSLNHLKNEQVGSIDILSEGVKVGEFMTLEVAKRKAFDMTA